MLQENASLRAHNTLGIDARTRYLLRVDSLAVLREALAWARAQRLPLLVIGEGSNLVLTRDWDGLVLLMALPGFRLVDEAADAVTLALGGGESWHGCVERSVAAGWYGLENLALIPGTAGATPVQNIGAYGREISELLVAIEAISLDDGQPHRLLPAQCGLRYRDSIFRGHCPNRWLITGIELRLSRRPQAQVQYPALAEYLRGQGIAPASAHPQQVMQAVMAVRRSKLPDPAVTPNAGSFFKNPLVPAAVHAALKAREPALVAHPAGADWKLAAGWLIEQAGYKGVLKDGVGTAPGQALVLTNPGHRDGQAVMAFAAEIRAAVQQRFGVLLEVEPLVV